MCGIVGYVGHRDAVAFILPGLRRLEYRGYDSAGIATGSRMSLDVRKTTGRIADLEALLASDRPKGTVGVGHTRWATHGGPSDANAHPHLDCHSQVAIVHLSRNSYGYYTSGRSADPNGDGWHRRVFWSRRGMSRRETAPDD